VKPLGPDEFLTQDELRRFLHQCLTERDRAMLLIAYRHGLRASEVGLLQVGDVDLVLRTLFCRRLRGSREGAQPLGSDEVRALRPLLKGRGPLEPLFQSREGTAISRKRLDAIMKTCGKKADLPPHKRHFQILRYSLAVHLVQAGGDPALADEVLGGRPAGGNRASEIGRLMGAKKIVTL
jgi:type 1 fimbriae regulatory protein FimB